MQHSITYSFNIAYTLKTNMYIDIKFSAIQYTSKCKEYISFKNETFHSLEFIPIYHVKKKEMFFHKYRKKKTNDDNICKYQAIQIIRIWISSHLCSGERRERTETHRPSWRMRLYNTGMHSV